MGHARNAALHLLNNDWSKSVWKHWLSNIFLPPVDPPMPRAGSAVPDAERVNTPPSPEVAQSKLDSSCSQQPSEPPDSAPGRDGRRSELRARFDALSDRLAGVEDGLETLLRLEGMLGIVARLEHALSRVERALGERNRRDSQAPGSAAPPRSPSQYPESVLAARDRGPGSVRIGDADEIDAHETSGVNGLLSEMSLSTVLAMLEIERHSGRLKVATDDGMLASFELAEGSVVSSRLSEVDADPLQTLRTALCWKQGRFWFRQQPAEAVSLAPRSIGSLLLEATRQNDESFAAVG